ncbi:MAG: dephospho-CoA kinase [Candidatus Gastranaerophilales bacterium]|nr:dephospho-CoA kinase [Candidatus Gastranaerophilales bacterium]
MKKIALTGNIGAGKSLAESILQEKNIPVIDCDKIGHDLLKNNDDVIFQVKNLFKNDNIQTIDGKIDRKKLGKIVFENEQKRIKLEKIIHPEILNKIHQFFEKNKNEKIAVVSIPLLFEIGWQKYFDKTILIIIDEKLQLERLLVRDNLNKEEIIARIKSQIPQSEKINKADFIIDNSGNIENTKKQVLVILDKISSQ